MASRIESSGEKNRIHLSKETARLLPESMVTIREDVVTLKGKGPQETYWLAVGASSANSHGSSLSDGSATISDNDQEYEEYEGTCLAGIVGQTKISKSIESLIDWNVDVLKPLLSAILAQRVARGNQLKNWEEASEVDFEVQVVIPFPPYNDDLAQKISKMAPTCIAGVVEKELRGYISAIATCYPKNACKSKSMISASNSSRSYMFFLIPLHS